MAVPNQPHTRKKLLQPPHAETQHLKALVWHATLNTAQQFQLSITDQHMSKSHLVLLGVKSEIKLFEMLLARSI